MFFGDPRFDLAIIHGLMREREKEAAAERIVRDALSEEPGLVDRVLAGIGYVLIEVGLALQERYAAQRRRRVRHQHQLPANGVIWSATATLRPPSAPAGRLLWPIRSCSPYVVDDRPSRERSA